MIDERPRFKPERATPTSVLTEYEHILLYGEGGTGKTFTAGTAPEPQWWLTPGGKNELKTVFSPAFQKNHGAKEIFVTSVSEDREKGHIKDDPEGYDRCCLAVDDFLQENEREGLGVKTIVVDNATVLEEYMMSKAIMAEYHMASNKEKTALKMERSFGIRKPHDSTYGGAQSLMDQFAHWLLELPFHVIFIGHTYEVYEAGDQRGQQLLKAIQPLFVGKQRTLIPNMFDNVWYMSVSGGGRSRSFGMRTEKTEKIQARTRVGGLLHPDRETNVNIAEIIERFADYAKSQEEN